MNANDPEKSSQWSGEEEGITGLGGREKVVRRRRQSCSHSLKEQRKEESRADSTPIGSPAKIYSVSTTCHPFYHDCPRPRCHRFLVRYLTNSGRRIWGHGEVFWKMGGYKTCIDADGEDPIDRGKKQMGGGPIAGI